MTRVAVSPEMLRWAVERSRRGAEPLSRRFPALPVWERGEARPTLKQLESFAKAAHVPFGYLFLPEPPDERVPIPDFRTAAQARIERPSPALLDTIYLCQQRQEWYGDYARTEGISPLPYVGSVSVESGVEETAAKIRRAIGFSLDAQAHAATWTDALRLFIGKADEAGVLVMVSGVVGSNNRYKLDPAEFRGFALSDALAPLIFINGADTKAAQMFTLAHELAHIWLGQSAVSDAQPSAAPDHRIERWCNLVAAELLAPLSMVRAEYQRGAGLHAEADRLARRFKVSTLVILRRIYDVGGLSSEKFWEAYHAELARLRAIPRGSGGDFYLTLGARASRRFTRALLASALEGRSSFTEAFRLLGFRKMATFRELALNLGVGF
jgi:Zn-dependent peptidase ImmA (M78 family)